MSIQIKLMAFGMTNFQPTVDDCYVLIDERSFVFNVIDDVVLSLLLKYPFFVLLHSVYLFPLLLFSLFSTPHVLAVNISH